MRNLRTMNKKGPAGVALFVIVAAAAPFVLGSTFSKDTLFMVLLYATCGVAWNMLSGYAGQTSLGHSLFFGIGAYTSTMLTVKLGISPWIGMLAGMALCCALTWLLGRFLFLLSGFYFSIATSALAEVFLIFFKSWNFIGDTRGLYLDPPGPKGDLWMINFSSKEPYCLVILALLLCTMLASYLMSKSRAGYNFRAIRDNTEAAVSLGVNINKYKTIAYMFSGAFCAMAGTVYACYLRYIDPDSVMKSAISVQICLISVLGGIGTLWGPVLGSTLLIYVSEYVRLQLGGSGTAVDQIIYALIIIIFAVLQPNGILGLVRDLKTKHNKRKELKRLSQAKGGS